MTQITFQNRMRYRLDLLISKGSIALISSLVLISALLILFVSFLVFISGVDPEKRGFLEITWAGLMRTLDTGTLSGDTGSWAFLLAMFVLTMVGVFMVGSFIGLLITGIEGKLEQLRKGRSVVAEEGHTIILGWSTQLFDIISELVQANESKPHSCIAILAQKDKVEMEDEIRARIGDTGRTQIVCRTGNPLEPGDLEIVNPYDARSIIILAPEKKNPDAHVIKMILALTNHSHQSTANIVTVLRDEKNKSVTDVIGSNRVQLVLADDLIARLTAQACRQSGLSVIYTEWLDFKGDEIYFAEEAGLVGKTFAEALLAYEDSSLIGLFTEGQVLVNPPMKTRIKARDQVIVIAEDESTIQLSMRPTYEDYQIDATAIQEHSFVAAKPERILILGWNESAINIIEQLDDYAATGSELTVVSKKQISNIVEEKLLTGPTSCRNVTISCLQGDITDPNTLHDLELQHYDDIVVLSSNDLSQQQSDARTLVTLLYLRQLAESHDHPFSLVSQMLDIRNRKLAEVARADDFIVSDKLISLILSQISENPQIAAVFQELFDAEGSEIYLKPATNYIQPGKAVNFYTVVEAAQRQNQVAVGYRLQAQAHDPAESYGVKLNPQKSKMITFTEQDRIVVLSEN